MFLADIQHKICCIPVLCSFSVTFSSKEGLDEISFCLDISLLWAHWTDSKQRRISGQNYIPVKETKSAQQKAVTNLILKNIPNPTLDSCLKIDMFVLSSLSLLVCSLFYLDCCHAGQGMWFLHICVSLTKRRSDRFQKCLKKVKCLLALLSQVGTLV